MKHFLFVLAVLICITTAAAAEVPRDPNAPPLIEGHPLTAVVVTQCNLIVAAYITTSNGKLYRFDVTSQDKIPADKLLELAYSAARSERIEISCDGSKAAFESHGDVL